MDKDNIKKIIEDIFKHTACKLDACEFTEEGSMLWCSVSTPDSRFMIGREGDTLKSLNHIVRKMIEKDISEAEAGMLMIDINGYNKKRFDSLKTTAHMLAERARYFKNSVELDPMPAYERRIVHMFLENIPDITTESSGVGPGRRVVIKYKEKEEI